MTTLTLAITVMMFGKVLDMKDDLNRIDTNIVVMYSRIVCQDNHGLYLGNGRCQIDIQK